MTFKNRKGPDESQIYRQTVRGSRTGDSEIYGRSHSHCDGETKENDLLVK